MNPLPDPTRQDLYITMSALLALLNSHRLMAEDKLAMKRVLAIVSLRYFGIDAQPKDLHP